MFPFQLIFKKIPQALGEKQFKLKQMKNKNKQTKIIDFIKIILRIN